MCSGSAYAFQMSRSYKNLCLLFLTIFGTVIRADKLSRQWPLRPRLSVCHVCSSGGGDTNPAGVKGVLLSSDDRTLEPWFCSSTSALDYEIYVLSVV